MLNHNVLINSWINYFSHNFNHRSSSLAAAAAAVNLSTCAAPVAAVVVFFSWRFDGAALSEARSGELWRFSSVSVTQKQSPLCLILTI